MLRSKNKHLMIALISGVVVFVATLSVLFSLTQSMESNSIKTRNLNSTKSLSQLSEFMKFSIEKTIIMMRGYEVYVKTNPDISEEETTAYLKNLIGEEKLIRSVAIVKDSTILYEYPKAENLSAIGVDLLKVPAQKDVFNKVKITMQPVFLGPVSLVQGGTGYIARTPIEVDGKYWGQVAIVLKADALNQQLQGYAKMLNLEITLFQNYPAERNLILGRLDILNEEPMLRTVSIIGSQYVVAAVEMEKQPVFDRFIILDGFAFIFSLLLAFVVYLGFMKSNDIRLQASRDKLTQLHNRSHLDSFLKVVFQKAKNTNSKIGIVVMDIDDFKNTNDCYGHLAGDAVLQGISTSLLAVCRKTETVFRLGGDEFLIIFQDITGRESIEAIVERILGGLPSTVNYKELAIPLSVSAGYSLYPEDGEEFDVLFKHADDQMYLKKREKKGAL